MDIAIHNTEANNNANSQNLKDPNYQENLSSPASADFDRDRIKSSNRMHYEAQVQVIRHQIGDLESIRAKLGLSQRKICQLLMVDPSAWTRWQKSEDGAPPVVWRALQWFLIIQEKIPGLTPQYFVGKDPAVLHQQALSKLNEEVAIREKWVLNLSEEMEKQSDRWHEQNQIFFQMQNEFKSEVFTLKKALRIYRVLFFASSVVLFILLLKVFSR